MDSVVEWTMRMMKMMRRVIDHGVLGRWSLVLCFKGKTLIFHFSLLGKFGYLLFDYSVSKSLELCVSGI